ncbi:MAG: YbaB/EbfC family nucleoid-associated protein [Acidiferrobacteraceae bacterium]|nr:YbaB/EbfC family nucleoid-associated protein [Acidiferrobacteraceae bacterium]|tara:strand:- start:3186 stop:3509 length:324 start_codon:yes stop_codon:yes gene_type:complete
MLNEKGLGSLFKQAQELQSKMAEAQGELAQKSVEASVGGGMVKITANGLNQILSVKIDDELIGMKDREVLEDLIVAAVNDINRKVKDLSQSEMSKLTGGMKIPGLFT